jgi:hypothetical protein
LILATTKHILGGQKVYHGKKKKKAGSTKVLLGTTSMCTYNVKIKECQITYIELFILGFLEACDLPKVTCRTLQTPPANFVDIR